MGGCGHPPLRNITKLIVGGDALIAPQKRLDRLVKPLLYSTGNSTRIEAQPQLSLIAVNVRLV